jgi:thiamine kinase-like enzyme
MTPEHLKELCNHLNLGHPIGVPERVYGGLLHLMWRVRTDRDSYAIKQLSNKIDLKNKDILKNYETTEKIANQFSNLKIPAISAIEKNGIRLIIIDDTGFLVYSWVNARGIKDGVVSEHHALKISEVLSMMHFINLDVPEISENSMDIYTSDKIIELIEKTEIHGCPFSSVLKKHQNLILSLHNDYENSLKLLRKNTVISHGDLDQKNVLWNSLGEPILIDWESACRLNPTYDIINTAFYWSGIITADFSPDLFIKMIRIYQKSGGIIHKESIEPAFLGTFSWLYWLFYNMERAYSSTESQEGRSLGVEQVNQTLDTIMRLKNVIPRLMKTLINQL